MRARGAVMPERKRGAARFCGAALLLLAALSLWLSDSGAVVSRAAAPALRAVFARGAAADAVAGIYVVYRRPKAFLTAALSFRDAYPETTFVLAGDAGCHDYRAAAAGFGADFVGPLRLTIKNGRMFLSAREALALFGVWRDVLARAPEPWFMHLEDDVRVIKRADAGSLRADVNGAVDFAVMEPRTEAWILARNAAPAGRAALGGKMYLGGMGGNILRAAFWRERLADWPRFAADVASLIDETHMRNIDGIVSALAYAYNGTVGFFDGYGGGWTVGMGERWFREALAVAHDEKGAYNLPLTPADLAALGPAYLNNLTLPDQEEEDLTKT